eukprot:Gb_41693 [translate_table: standard]
MSQGIHIFSLVSAAASFGGDGRRRMYSIQAGRMTDGTSFSPLGSSPILEMSRRGDLSSMLHAEYMLSRSLLMCKRPLHAVQACIPAFAMKTGQSEGFGKQKRLNHRKEDSEHSQPLPLPAFTSAPNNPQLKPSSTSASSESDIVALFMKVKSQPKEARQVKDKDQRVHLQAAKPKGTADSVLKVLQRYSYQGDLKNKSSLQHPTSCEDGISTVQTSTSESISESQHLKSVVTSTNSLEESSQTNELSFKRLPSNFVRRSPIIASVVRQQDQLASASSPAEGKGFEDASFKLGHGDKNQRDSSLHYSVPKIPESTTSVNTRESESSTTVQVVSSLIEQMDLSTLRLPEMRIIAKSRGLKGYSKLKKADLLELLKEDTS